MRGEEEGGSRRRRRQTAAEHNGRKASHVEDRSCARFGPCFKAATSRLATVSAALGALLPRCRPRFILPACPALRLMLRGLAWLPASPRRLLTTPNTHNRSRRVPLLTAPAPRPPI